MIIYCKSSTNPRFSVQYRYTMFMVSHDKYSCLYNDYHGAIIWWVNHNSHRRIRHNIIHSFMNKRMRIITDYIK